MAKIDIKRKVKLLWTLRYGMRNSHIDKSMALNYQDNDYSGYCDCLHIRKIFSLPFFNFSSLKKDGYSFGIFFFITNGD